jgi:Grap2 and cyclin-D-interacting
MVSEFQNLASGEYPEYFVVSVRKEIEELFDTMVVFLGEVVEIACGDADVESRDRLQYSGMMLAICDRIQQICKDGPIKLLRDKLRETEEMLSDAINEVAEINDDETMLDDVGDDGWGGPVAYTPEEMKFAERVQSKLRLLSFLYKAIAKRRIPASLTYEKTFRTTVETIHTSLSQLRVTADELVSGISAQEEPMSLELSVVQISEASRKLANAVRVTLTGSTDGKEEWFDTWQEKMS